MNYPKYKENRMVEGIPGQCSVSCVMGILNYFRYTSFTGKDYYEVMQFMKKGKFRFNQDELLLEHEIGLRLSELGFDVTIYYSTSKSRRIDFMNNPSIEQYKTFLSEKYHRYIQGEYWVDPNDWYSVADGNRSNLTDTKLEKELHQRLIDKKISIVRSADIFEVIRKNQKEGTLFLTGLDSYALYEKKQEDDQPSGGHIVIIKKIIGDNCVVFDPGPALGNGYKKSISIMKYAIEDFGEYVFIEVKEIDVQN